MGEREQQAVVGDFLEFERAAHAEIESAADEDERDVIERVGVAFAELVGPDDERVIEQRSAAAGFGGVGQALGEVGELLAVPLVDAGEFVDGIFVACRVRAKVGGGLR